MTPQGASVTGARLHLVDALEADVEFETTFVRPLADSVQRTLCEPLGVVAAHADLDPMRVHEAFATGESALANYLADALVVRCQAAGFPVDFAMLDASTICAGLPPGQLTYGDIFRLVPHSDSIVLRRFGPEQLQALLDDNARRACRPGERYEEHGFVQFSREVRYRIVGRRDRGDLHAIDATINGVSPASMSAGSSAAAENVPGRVQQLRAAVRRVLGTQGCRPGAVGLQPAPAAGRTDRPRPARRAGFICA